MTDICLTQLFTVNLFQIFLLVYVYITLNKKIDKFEFFFPKNLEEKTMHTHKVIENQWKT